MWKGKFSNWLVVCLMWKVKFSNWLAIEIDFSLIKGPIFEGLVVATDWYACVCLEREREREYVYMFMAM